MQFQWKSIRRQFWVFLFFFFLSLKEKIKAEVIREEKMLHLKWLNISYYPEWCSLEYVQFIFRSWLGRSLLLNCRLWSDTGPRELSTIWTLCVIRKIKEQCSVRRLKVQCFESSSPKHISMEENVLWKLTKDIEPHT